MNDAEAALFRLIAGALQPAEMLGPFDPAANQHRSENFRDREPQGNVVRREGRASVIGWLVRVADHYRDLESASLVMASHLDHFLERVLTA